MATKKVTKKLPEPDPYAWPSQGRTQVTVEYDEEKIEALASVGCPIYEIAALCGFSESHFHELKKTYPDIQEAINRGKANMHKSLRKKQVDLALEGNVPMLIHLGKTELGQNDKIELNQHINAEVEYEIRFGEALEKDNQTSEASPSSSDDSE
jgi:hypothetical protein